MDSKREKKEEESEDENLSEEQGIDSNETEIKFLEWIFPKFDGKRINDIVNNGELLLELKQNYENYNADDGIKMSMTLLETFIRSTITSL